MPRGTAFLSSLADKAQSAIHASPLAGHLPASMGRPSSPDNVGQPTANEAAAQGGHKSHALESIQYQLRSFGQQYATTNPVQKIITSEKGVAIDFDSVSRDAKSQSKELYTWGQTEDDDLRDVTDRLAYLNFVQGSLATSLAAKLDAARAPLKALRDAETNLVPRRNIRAGMKMQLTRIEHDQQQGLEKKVLELKDQLRKAELDDQPQEKEVDLLKRKAIRESEQLKWEAIREYGEKLVLLSQAATPIIAALPSLPPTPNNPYTGAQATGAARASLQRALDNYKTGHINLPPQSAGSELSRSDTRSFGETHASELSSISSEDSAHTHPGISMTPPPGSQPPLQQQQHHPPSAFKSSSIPTSPIDPSTLNQSPAPIPALHPNVSVAASPAVATQAPTVLPDPSKPAGTVPHITPTIAETGVPVSAGVSGPGPASGSLHDIKGAPAAAGPRSGGLQNESQAPAYGQGHQALSTTVTSSQPNYESAEAEKQRLQREDRERLLASSGAPALQPQPIAATSVPTSTHETAEDEKKRLEREERERIFRRDTADNASTKDDEDLPPYQD